MVNTRTFFIFFHLITLTLTANATQLPDGFVYLEDIDPTIIQDMRYCSAENFIGRVLPGYKKPRAILTKETALALAEVQKNLRLDGYSLVIYEAYRPQKASDFVVKWSLDDKDTAMKSSYYPNFTKKYIIDHSYVAPQSRHSQGGTVDISIIKVGTSLKPIERSERLLKNGTKILFLDDGTVDMGSSVDLLDFASHHDSPLVFQKYLDQRNYLKAKMVARGWRACTGEWWHYTYTKNRYIESKKYFDFDVE